MPTDSRPPTPNPTHMKGNEKNPAARPSSAFYKHTAPRWLLRQDSEHEKDDTADAALRLWDISTRRENSSDMSLTGEMVLPMRRSNIANDEAAFKPRRRRVEFDFSSEVKVKQLAVSQPPSRAASRSRANSKRPYACMPFDPKSMKTQQNINITKPNSANSPRRETGNSTDVNTNALSRHPPRIWEDDFINKFSSSKRNSCLSNPSQILPPPPQFSSLPTMLEEDLGKRRSIHEKYGASFHSLCKNENSNNVSSGWGTHLTTTKPNSPAKDLSKQSNSNKTGCISSLRASLSDVPTIHKTRSSLLRFSKDNSTKRDERLFSTASQRMPLELRQALRRHLHPDKSAEVGRNRQHRTYRTASDLRLARAVVVGHKLKKDSLGGSRPISEIGLRGYRSTYHPFTTPTWSSTSRKCDISGINSLLGDLSRRSKANVTPLVPWGTKHNTCASEIELHGRRHKLRDPLSAKLPQMKCSALMETGGCPKRYNTAESLRRSNTPKCSTSNFKGNSFSEALLQRPMCSADKLNNVQEWLKKKRSAHRFHKSASDLELFTHRTRHQDRFKSGGAVRVWSFPKNTPPLEIRQTNKKVSCRDVGHASRSNASKRYECSPNINRILQEPCHDTFNVETCVRLSSARNKTHSKLIPLSDPRSKCVNCLRSSSLTRYWDFPKTPSEPRLNLGKICSRNNSPARSLCHLNSSSNLSEPHHNFDKNQTNSYSQPTWVPQKSNPTVSDLRSVLKAPSTARASSVTRNVAFTPKTDSVTYNTRNSISQISGIIPPIASCFEPRNWVPCISEETSNIETRYPTTSRPPTHERTPKQNSHSGKRLTQSPLISSVSLASERENLEIKIPILIKSRSRSPSNKSYHNQVSKNDNVKKLPSKRKKNNFNTQVATTDVEKIASSPQQKIRNEKTENAPGRSPKRIISQMVQEQNTRKVKINADSKSPKNKRNMQNKPGTSEEYAKLFLSRRTNKDDAKQRKDNRKTKKREIASVEVLKGNKKQGRAKPERRKLNVQVPLPTELLQTHPESIDSRDSLHRKCEVLKKKHRKDSPKESATKPKIESEKISSSNSKKQKGEKIKKCKESIIVKENKLTEETPASVASLTTGFKNTITCVTKILPDTTISSVTDLETDELKKTQKEKKLSKETNGEAPLGYRSSHSTAKSDDTSAPNRDISLSIFAEYKMNDRKLQKSNTKLAPTQMDNNNSQPIDETDATNAIAKTDKKITNITTKKKPRNRVSKTFDSLPLHNQYALNDFSALLGIARLLDLDPNTCMNMVRLDLTSENSSSSMHVDN